MTVNKVNKEEIRDKVRERYAKAITAKSGCGFRPIAE